MSRAAKERHQSGDFKRAPLSDEERARRSERAKELVAQGKFGGAEIGKLGGQPTHRAYKERVAKRVAEAAQNEEMAEALIQVFRDAIQPSMPPNIRIKAAEALIAIEREEARISMAEEEASSKSHTREELLQALSGSLTKGPVAALLRRQMEGQDNPPIEAEAEEIPVMPSDA